jgi:hypothetical protein
MADAMDSFNALMGAFMNPGSSTYQGFGYTPQASASGAAGVGAKIGSMFGGDSGAQLGGVLGQTFGGMLGINLDNFSENPFQSYYTRQLSAARQRAFFQFQNQQMAPISQAVASATGISADTASRYMPLASMFFPGAMQGLARSANATFFDSASVAALDNVATLGIVQGGIHGFDSQGRDNRQTFYTNYYNQMSGMAGRLASQGISSGAIAHAGILARRTVAGGDILSSRFSESTERFASSINLVSQALGVDSATATMHLETMGGGRSVAGADLAQRMITDTARYATLAGMDPNAAMMAGSMSAAGAGLSKRFGGMIAGRAARAAALVGNLDSDGQSEYVEASARGFTSAARSAEGQALAHALTHGDAATQAAARAGKLDLLSHFNRNYNSIRLNDTGSNLKALTDADIGRITRERLKNEGTPEQRAEAARILGSNDSGWLARIAEKGSGSQVLSASVERQLSVLRQSELASNSERLEKSIALMKEGEKKTDASPESLAKSIKTVMDSAQPAIDKLVDVFKQLAAALGNDLKASRDVAKAAAQSVTVK